MHNIESQDEEVLSNYKIKETGTRSEVYKYNPLNLNVEILEPNGGVTQIEYDSMGRVVKVTEALGRV